MKKISHTIVDFTGVHSSLTIERELRGDPISFIEFLYSSSRIEILSDEIRIGNKNSRALYLDDFHWHSYETDAHGVGLIRLAQEEWGTDFKDALARLAAFLKNRNNSDTTYKRIAIKKKTPQQRRQEEIRKRERALEIIYTARSVQGTRAAHYLYSRDIPINALTPWAVRQLGFHARLYHKESDKHWPTLIASIRNHTGTIVAVHRIYLEKKGLGKAPVERPKKTLASTKGASIQLTPTREYLILTEGLEDGLTILRAVKDDRRFGVWCGVGGNLHNIIIPKKTVRCMVLAVDNDAGGRGYIKELAPRLMRQGFRVYIAVPTLGKDFNEMLCRYGRFFNPDMMEEYHE